MSVRDTGVKVDYGDKLITLSTCAYHVKDGKTTKIHVNDKLDDAFDAAA